MHISYKTPNEVNYPSTCTACILFLLHQSKLIFINNLLITTFISPTHLTHHIVTMHVINIHFSQFLLQIIPNLIFKQNKVLTLETPFQHK